MKKMSEMPWDNEDFVEAMRQAWQNGYRSGESDGYSYYSSGSKATTFTDFMEDAVKGYED